MIPEHRFRILVVDDEEELAMIMGAHLKISGYEYAIASSGEEGLDRLLRERFDLVICDFVMPGMDGYSFFNETRERGISIPFIFCSGLDESPFHDERREGIVAFLQKPFAMSELINSISKFLLHSEK